LVVTELFATGLFLEENIVIEIVQEEHLKLIGEELKELIQT
jgi:hypothetical protein